MQLTRYTEYSLRVLMYLALHTDRLATITEISGAYNISRNHLVKVVHELGTLGFIKTQRGKQGGIRLARAADTLKLGEVVRKVERNLEIVDCTEPACPILPVCDIRDVLFEARDAFFDVLDSYTLDDLTTPRRKQLVSLLSLNGR